MNSTEITHKVPNPSLAVSPIEGPVGTVVTINGAGFRTYSVVSTLKIGGIDVRPVPIPATDSEGGFSVTVLVPQSSEVGSVSVTATVASTTATSTYVVTLP